MIPITEGPTSTNKSLSYTEPVFRNNDIYRPVPWNVKEKTSSGWYKTLSRITATLPYSKPPTYRRSV